MIREIIERRRRKKILGTFRKDMSEMGVFTGHLTDDELLEVVSKWTVKICEVFKPIMASMARIVEVSKGGVDGMSKV